MAVGTRQRTRRKSEEQIDTHPTAPAAATLKPHPNILPRRLARELHVVYAESAAGAPRNHERSHACAVCVGCGKGGIALAGRGRVSKQYNNAEGTMRGAETHTSPAQGRNTESKINWQRRPGRIEEINKK
jgi:hypothetical protein